MEQERDCFGYYTARITRADIDRLSRRLAWEGPLEEGEQIAESLADHGAAYQDSVGYWN